MPTLAQLVSDARKNFPRRGGEKGLTLREAGSRCGVSRTLIWKIENSEYTYDALRTLHAISAGLQIPYEEIERSIIEVDQPDEEMSDDRENPLR